MLVLMGVVAILIETDGRRVTRLDDPGGGTFDAAGDFDRLLDGSDLHPVLGSLDVYGITTLEYADMDDLIADIDRIVAAETLQPLESRGLQRLRVMAEECARRGDLQIVLVGD